jgi:general secretion pathway protein G
MNNPIENPSLSNEDSLIDFPCSKHVDRRGCNRGFTLIELFIVMAIIGTLSAIAVPNYLRYKYKAMIVVAVSDIRMIEKQISLFAEENDGQLPNKLSDLTTIKTVKDPWGNPYQYLRIDGGSEKGKDEKVRRNMSDNPVNTDYDLYSMGKNGLSKPQFKFKESQDDVVRAYDGQYVGLVSEL